MRCVAIPSLNACNRSAASPIAVKSTAAARPPNVAILSAAKRIAVVQPPSKALMPVVAISHLLQVLTMNMPVARKNLVAMTMHAASRHPVT